VKGRRLANAEEFFNSTEPGTYLKATGPDGGVIWWIRDPNGNPGRLEDHTVTEHPDGTITVSPSILDPSPGGWHGFLERGKWRQA
jgi:hypothetical protein